MLSVLISALVVSLAFSGKLIPKSEIPERIRMKKSAVAFYNVYAQGKDYDYIVQTQVKTVKGSGLLDVLDNVYYATMGNAGKDYDIGNDEKYVHIDHYGNDGSELQTLSLLHKFCHSNPESKVLYFSNLGSEHHSYANVKMCNGLNCYVLNPHCIEALDTHDTCGWRISPTPHPHYSGNFWWARCEYVNTLIDPMAPINNQTFTEAAKAFPCSGLDKHNFAEAWIGTGPTIFPADCMNATIDSSYVWGYGIPHAAEAFCHGPDEPSGLACQTAATFADTIQFRKAVKQMDALIPAVQCRDNRAELINRSFMMYGEAPHTYVEWVDRLYSSIKLPDGDLVRFTDSAQVYISRGGELRGVPDLKTFLTLGRDFDEVKVLYASERLSYDIGQMLPNA